MKRVLILKSPDYLDYVGSTVGNNQGGCENVGKSD